MKNGIVVFVFVDDWLLFAKQKSNIAYIIMSLKEDIE